MDKSTQTHFKNNKFLFATKMQNIFRHILVDEEDFDKIGDFITKGN